MIDIEKCIEIVYNQWLLNQTHNAIFCNRAYHTCLVYSNLYINASQLHHQYEYKIIFAYPHTTKYPKLVLLRLLIPVTVTCITLLFIRLTKRWWRDDGGHLLHCWHALNPVWGFRFICHRFWSSWYTLQWVPIQKLEEKKKHQIKLYLNNKSVKWLYECMFQKNAVRSRSLSRCVVTYFPSLGEPVEEVAHQVPCWSCCWSSLESKGQTKLYYILLFLKEQS